ncbi:hypothetical protein [Halocatena marina]|uniref:Uncharacterized protein n=1 Tax=Halocatena marina TaxID=2934937 RepID=A0ABD5YT65_9EURY|nr:hypothetical protein [Halocatena marina]
MTASWSTIRERTAERTDRIVSDVQSEWGTTLTVAPFDLGPRPHDAEVMDLEYASECRHVNPPSIF